MKLYICALVCLAGSLFAQAPPPHPAFNSDAVHEIRITFPNADWYDVLRANYSGTEAENPYFPASLEWGAYKFDQIGVRFKGNSSYRVNGQKKPFRIKLNEFVKGQKIEGMASFSLSNGWNDPSFVREKVYYEFAAALGLKAPRSNFAALYINGKYWGLYILTEVINGDFLKHYFGKNEDTGNLYKGNIGASLSYLGENKAAYKQVWEKQSNEDADDWSDLIALSKLLSETAVSDLRAKLEPLVDIDSVLTALALDNATVNLDSYVGMGQNFNIYRRPSDQRWVWLVWDPSLAFGALNQGQTAQGMQTLALEWANTGGATGGGPGGVFPGGGGPGGSGGRPLATKLWDVPEYKERYRQIYKRLVENVFRGDATVARMNTLRDMIRPWVQMDTQKLVTMDQFEQAMTSDSGGTQGGGPGGGVPGGGIPGGGGPGGGLGGVPGLKPFIEARVTYVTGQLASTVPSVIISADTSALSFSQAAGGSAAARTVSLTFSGAQVLPFYSVFASTQTGGNWLAPTPTGGSVPGKFSVALSASDLAAGTYQGQVAIYSPSAANSPLTIPVSLTVGAGAQTVAPAIASIVNAASYQQGAIAPGEILTIFGTGLGPSTLASAAFSGGRLATAVSGIQVTFDGTPAPILYARADQLSVVAPFEISGRTQTSIRVVNSGQQSAAVTQTVATTAPGLFTANASGSGGAAIVNQAGSINSTAAPAPKGSAVSIYLTGAGQTNPPGSSGGVGQASPLQAISAPVTVTIGGEPAAIAYSGAAPGLLQGLYQINAVVPSAIASGTAAIQVAIGGRSAQTGVTMFVQ